jgi:2-keto-4-pentenoate hydratase/2-oxohepta-3-ene-1,7-dioic acid hydratase in catechol pathway
MDKIICVGKNYLKHALELGDAVPETPTYFLKPPSTVHTVTKNNEIVDLPARGEVHHEIELVFRIQKENGGPARFSHYTLGLDLTLRSLQAELKKAGQPWEKAKVFKNACILGDWRECDSLSEVLEMPFELKVNGKTRQKAKGHDMRWKPDFVLNDLPNWFPVCDNDLLFTGTPEGVGPLLKGDVVEVAGGNIEYMFKCGIAAHA